MVVLEYFLGLQVVRDVLILHAVLHERIIVLYYFLDQILHLIRARVDSDVAGFGGH